MAKRNAHFYVVVVDLYCGYCEAMIPASKDGRSHIVEDLSGETEIYCECGRSSKIPHDKFATQFRLQQSRAAAAQQG